MILKNNNYKKLLNSKLKCCIVFENVDVSVHKKEATKYLVRIFLTIHYVHLFPPMLINYLSIDKAKQ